MSAPAASLDLLLEVAPDAIVVVDDRDEILAVNARAEDLFRLERDRMVGRSVDELFSRPWLRLRRTGASLELPALRGDGTEFPAEISIASFEGAAGTLTAAAIRDGSERAGREAELREARERFRRVFEDGPVAMALVGDDFRLSEVNDAFCQLTGYSARELAELTFADITHPDDVDADLRLARRVFAGEVRSYTIDKRYIRKDGEVIWIALSVSVIREQATFEDRFEDRDFAIGVFNAHNEDVQSKVPEEQLLVYEIKQGWEPLCEFLEVPVPDTPMPHLNDAASFRAMVGLPALPA